MDDRVYTIKTALAEYFQGALGETKLRQAIREGKIPHIRVDARILLRKSALDAWAAEQERQSMAKSQGRLRLAR